MQETRSDPLASVRPPDANVLVPVAGLIAIVSCRRAARHESIAVQVLRAE